ncbi:MAG: RluA family pseudouridine synthase [Proteobacteria bacterium]|nr:RluA family pseudouridine synthase [Pseudomonadota bacterium]
MAQPIFNISAYRFARLENLKPLREEILSLAKTLKLKGTVLISQEGINLFVAGPKDAIEQFLTFVKSIPGLEGLAAKYSQSDYQPFNRMLVRIKKEIISFGVDGIDPVGKPAPKITAEELKKWLDEKRPLTLLDTRNEYEVKLGTFKDAVNPHIDTFRQFPQFVEKLKPEMKEEPIVMFCTGGIRCEKAGPFMEKMGFKNVFQLDGGILKYFEKVGGAHYEGDCFVFDGRVGVDPYLSETPHKLCFACLAPLTAEEQQRKEYILGKSCPYCFKDPESSLAEKLARRQKLIEEATQVLPGAEPYEQLRPLRVPQKYDGKTALEFVSGVLSHVPVGEWEKEFEQSLFLDESHRVVGAERKVKAGERYLHVLPKASEPPVNPNVGILYEDESIIIVNKPAPLPVHPSGRFQRNTLQYILNRVYYPRIPKPIHRLDANTTGLVVYAISKSAARDLQRQFEQRKVEKIYWARVQGNPKKDEFSCDIPISQDAGEVGSRTIDEKNGLPAKTDFKVIKRFEDNTTLLEVRPLTGRTNQIRIHLWTLGFPICGEQLYLSENKLGQTQTRHPSDKPLCLHASRLRFTHPISKKSFEYASEPVAWMN